MRNEWVIIVLVVILVASFAVQTLLVLWLMRQDRYLIQPIVGPPGPMGPQGLSGQCNHKEDQ